MASTTSRTFDSVKLRDESGAADAEGFRLCERAGDVPPAFPFSVCRIDGRDVAVLVEMAIPVEVRASLAARKPDWLDAAVYATVISDPFARDAVIDAQLLSPTDADLAVCGFATACVAYSYGLFKVDPKNYVIRFEARDTVIVTMAFDDDSESWFGEVALNVGDIR